MPSVFFYISGHGFGHASRQIEVVNALSARLNADAGSVRLQADRGSGHEIVVRTSAARWLFDRTVRAPVTFVDGPCDTGVVQIDSLRLDAGETIARAADFYRHLPAHVEREAALLRRHEARFVISDAPPLACAAASRAGVPSVVVSNFTWDWIYEAYAEELKSAPDLIPTIHEAYRGASSAWRLPLHGGFATFDSIIDVPFLARHAAHERRDVRQRLHLPAGVPLALSSFGGYGVRDFDPQRLDCLDEWCVILTGREEPPGLPRGLRFMHEWLIYDAGLRYEDLVAAVDVVVTKPGFGIVAECLANRTAMLYTSRGRFAEYDVMVAEMPQFLKCEYLPLDDLLAGRWRDALARLVRQPEPPGHPRTDGAEVVADMIVERLAHSSDSR